MRSGGPRQAGRDDRAPTQRSEADRADRRVSRGSSPQPKTSQQSRRFRRDWEQPSPPRSSSPKPRFTGFRGTSAPFEFKAEPTVVNGRSGPAGAGRRSARQPDGGIGELPGNGSRSHPDHSDQCQHGDLLHRDRRPLYHTLRWQKAQRSPTSRSPALRSPMRSRS